MGAFKDTFLLSYHGKAVQELWDEFTEHLEKFQAECVPSKILRGKKSLPWITQDIRRAIRKRNRLYDRLKRTKCPKVRKGHLRLRHLVRKKIQLAHNKYIEALLGVNTDDDTDDRKVNTKRLFTYLKSSRKDSEGISPLQSKGRLHSDTITKANILKKQFQSVFSDRNPMTNDDHTAQPGNITAMPEIDISINGIIKLLGNLNPTKAAGRSCKDRSVRSIYYPRTIIPDHLLSLWRQLWSARKGLIKDRFQWFVHPSHR